jgi:hypothetical protein
MDRASSGRGAELVDQQQERGKREKIERKTMNHKS